jgi:hypothetical protein
MLSIIFVVGDSFVVLNPPLPQAAKRYVQLYEDYNFNIYIHYTLWLRRQQPKS